MFKSFAAKDIIPYDITEVQKGIVFENDDFMIKVATLKHSTTCIGFQFIEKDMLRIDLKKAKKLGLQEGPMLGKLQQGKDIVINGKKIKADEVTYLVPGKKISYVTDTMECDGVNELAQDCDVLILEGTLLDDLKANAIKSKHLTVKQAALIANGNNVEKLVITHISQRYKTNSVIAEEAQQYFDNVVVAEDFMKIDV